MTGKQTYEDESNLCEYFENNTSNLSTPLWTVEDVAEFLQLQPETIRSMARRGELPAIKFGKVWRFEKAAINKMLLSLV